MIIFPPLFLLVTGGVGVSKPKWLLLRCICESNLFLSAEEELCVTEKLALSACVDPESVASLSHGTDSPLFH